MLWYAVGRGLAPLEALRREIENRSHRDLSALPVEQTPQEVRPLIRAMNELLERLSLALAAQQRFIADAAHQLRTPIAGLKTQTELALRQTPRGRSARHAAAAAERDRADDAARQPAAVARARRAARSGACRRRAHRSRAARARRDDRMGAARARAQRRPRLRRGFAARRRRRRPVPAARDAEQPARQRDPLHAAAAARSRCASTAQRRTRRCSRSRTTARAFPTAERARVFERFYRVLGTGAEGCGLGLAIVQRDRAKPRRAK